MNSIFLLQAWLQEFAWARRDIDRRQKGLLKQLPSMNPRLRQQPIFCMETALKMVLWSSLVYESECSEGRIAVMKADSAMRLPVKKVQESSSDSGSESVDDSAKSSSGLDSEVGQLRSDRRREVFRAFHPATIDHIAERHICCS